MPQVSCPYCDEPVRYISRDKLPDILRKHLTEGTNHDPREDFESVDDAVAQALREIGV